jgi:hypothetical protein
LKIQAEFTLAEEGGDYSNIMNFSTGVLHFRRNYKEGNDNINATQVTAYQYLADIFFFQHIFGNKICRKLIQTARK